MTRKKRGIKNIFFAWLMIFNLVVFQFYPTLAVLAEETATEEKEDSFEEEKTDETEKEPKEEPKEEPEEEPEEDKDVKEEIIEKETEEKIEKDGQTEKENSSLEENASQEEKEVESSGENVLSLEEIIQEDGEKNEEKECDCSTDQEEDNQGENVSPISEDCVKICQVIEVENSNEAVLENSAVSNSMTGENSLMGSEVQNQTKEKDSVDTLQEEDEGNQEKQEASTENIIATGEAVSVSNIINDVNSNKIGNNFEDLIINIFGEENGDINLYEKFTRLIEDAKELTEEQKTAFTAFLVENYNNAVVANNAGATAESGKNSIEGTDGDSRIDTGDSIAIANIINIINRNLTGNNWLFSVVNVLGTWNGDLIVPGEGVISVPEPSQAYNYEVVNENRADVSNDVNAFAETGYNNIDLAGEAVISSGQASSLAVASNILNTNIVKNNWFFLIVNNMGNWSGNIFNWSGEKFSGFFQFDFQISDLLEGIPSGGILNVKNVNNAEVKNSATAFADSGGNLIENADEARITTGNASALARVFNFINTNITGNNWMFSVVNVMGEWNGDLQFAYPDLSISLSDGKEEAEAGDVLVYSIKLKNEGQAACENARVMFSLNDEMSFEGGSSEVDKKANGNELVWEIPGLSPGEEKFFSVKAKIKDLEAGKKYSLMSAAGVTTKTKELALANNSSSDVVEVEVPASFKSDEKNDVDSHISIKREMDRQGTLRPGDLMKHTFYIKNNGEDHLYNVVLQDKMKDALGQEITIYQWEIGDLPLGQEIMVDYTLQANDIGKNVDFLYEAIAYGTNGEEDEVRSRKVSARVSFLGGFFAWGEGESDQSIIPTAEAAEENPTPEVLGATTREKNVPWQWLWLLLVVPSAYIINKKELYRWRNIQQMARQAASAVYSLIF